MASRGAGSFLVAAEPKSACIIRIRGISAVSPRVQQVPEFYAFARSSLATLLSSARLQLTG